MIGLPLHGHKLYGNGKTPVTELKLQRFQFVLGISQSIEFLQSNAARYVLRVGVMMRRKTIPLLNSQQ